MSGNIHVLLPTVGCLTLAAVALGALTFIVLREAKAMQSVRLQFARDLTPEVMARVMDRLVGLHRGVVVVLDVRADHAGISHFLHADQATIETLRGAFRALLPSLRLESIDPCFTPDADFRAGRSIRLRGRLGVIRSDELTAVSSGLLAALQPLGVKESVLLRWVISSARPLRIPAASQGQAIESEERRRLRDKSKSGVLRARGLIAVQAGHPKRAAHLMGRLSSVMRTRSTAYGQLFLLPLRRERLRVALARVSFWSTDRYSSAELAGLMAWPVDAPGLPGLTLGTSPQLIASARLPRSGRVLGQATWPGDERPVAQPVTGAMSHSLITGPTGVGKSTLLTRLICSDVDANRGVVVIDGKGDTIQAVLERIPKGRRDDVVVLDCASAGPQPGLQLFSGGDPELEGDVVVGVLADLFKDTWGPLSQKYLTAGVAAVAHAPNGTLADVPYVFSDANYRRQLLGKLRDPLVKSTLFMLDEMSPAERQQQLAAAFNRLGTLIGRPIIRNVMGQAEPKLNFQEVLRGRKIVLISVSPMRVGGPAARLIGAVSIFGLFRAVQSRIALPESARSPFLVYIDEPKALGDLPMPLDALLEQARGLGVGVTLAPQSINQLPRGVREAALTNVATRVIFRQSADDARVLSRDLRGVSAEQLQDLDAHEVVARVGLGPGELAPPTTIRTEPLPSAISDPDELRARSARRYGLSLREVDRAIDERHQLRPQSTATVGRKRRSL